MDNKAEQKAQQEKLKLERQSQIEDVRQVSDLPAGKRWFKRLASQAYVFTTTLDGKNSVYNEGKRCLAINCLVELALANRSLCAEIFTELLEQEGIEQENRHD